MPDEVLPAEEGVVGHLSAWTDREVRSHRETMEAAQTRPRPQFSSRLIDTGLFLDQLTRTG